MENSIVFCLRFLEFNVCYFYVAFKIQFPHMLMFYQCSTIHQLVIGSNDKS